MAGSATVEKRLDFGLLGPLQMTIDGTPVPSGTQATGCASHVGHQPQQARRSRRPNHRPLGGVATLGRTRSIHSYVSNLRKLLGGAGIDPRVVLAAAPPGYRLSIPDNTCDLGRFVAEKPRACTRPPPAGSNKPAATCRPH